MAAANTNSVLSSPIVLSRVDIVLQQQKTLNFEISCGEFRFSSLACAQPPITSSDGLNRSYRTLSLQIPFDSNDDVIISLISTKKNALSRSRSVAKGSISRGELSLNHVVLPDQHERRATQGVLVPMKSSKLRVSVTVFPMVNHAEVWLNQLKHGASNALSDFEYMSQERMESRIVGYLTTNGIAQLQQMLVVWLHTKKTTKEEKSAAKTKSGRNALALAVWNRDMIHRVWVNLLAQSKVLVTLTRAQVGPNLMPHLVPGLPRLTELLELLKPLLSSNSSDSKSMIGPLIDFLGLSVQKALKHPQVKRHQLTTGACFQLLRYLDLKFLKPILLKTEVPNIIGSILKSGTVPTLIDQAFDMIKFFGTGLKSDMESTKIFEALSMVTDSHLSPQIRLQGIYILSKFSLMTPDRCSALIQNIALSLLKESDLAQRLRSITHLSTVLLTFDSVTLKRTLAHAELADALIGSLSSFSHGSHKLAEILMAGAVPPEILLQANFLTHFQSILVSQSPDMTVLSYFFNVLNTLSKASFHNTSDAELATQLVLLAPPAQPPACLETPKSSLKSTDFPDSSAEEPPKSTETSSSPLPPQTESDPPQHASTSPPISKELPHVSQSSVETSTMPDVAPTYTAPAPDAQQSDSVPSSSELDCVIDTTPTSSIELPALLYLKSRDEMHIIEEGTKVGLWTSLIDRCSKGSLEDRIHAITFCFTLPKTIQLYLSIEFDFISTSHDLLVKREARNKIPTEARIPGLLALFESACFFHSLLQPSACISDRKLRSLAYSMIVILPSPTDWVLATRILDSAASIPELSRIVCAQLSSRASREELPGLNVVLLPWLTEKFEKLHKAPSVMKPLPAPTATNLHAWLKLACSTIIDAPLNLVLFEMDIELSLTKTVQSQWRWLASFGLLDFSSHPLLSRYVSIMTDTSSPTHLYWSHGFTIPPPITQIAKRVIEPHWMIVPDDSEDDDSDSTGTDSFVTMSSSSSGLSSYSDDDDEDDEDEDEDESTSDVSETETGSGEFDESDSGTETSLSSESSTTSDPVRTLDAALIPPRGHPPPPFPHQQLLARHLPLLPAPNNEEMEVRVEEMPFVGDEFDQMMGRTRDAPWLAPPLTAPKKKKKAKRRKRQATSTSSSLRASWPPPTSSSTSFSESSYSSSGSSSSESSEEDHDEDEYDDDEDDGDGASTGDSSEETDMSDSDMSESSEEMSDVDSSDTGISDWDTTEAIDWGDEVNSRNGSESSLTSEDDASSSVSDPTFARFCMLFPLMVNLLPMEKQTRHMRYIKTLGRVVPVFALDQTDKIGLTKGEQYRAYCFSALEPSLMERLSSDRSTSLTNHVVELLLLDNPGLPKSNPDLHYFRSYQIQSPLTLSYIQCSPMSVPDDGMFLSTRWSKNPVIRAAPVDDSRSGSNFISTTDSFDPDKDLHIKPDDPDTKMVSITPLANPEAKLKEIIWNLQHPSVPVPPHFLSPRFLKVFLSWAYDFVDDSNYTDKVWTLLLWILPQAKGVCKIAKHLLRSFSDYLTTRNNRWLSDLDTHALISLLMRVLPDAPTEIGPLCRGFEFGLLGFASFPALELWSYLNANNATIFRTYYEEYADIFGLSLTDHPIVIKATKTTLTLQTRPLYFLHTTCRSKIELLRNSIPSTFTKNFKLRRDVQESMHANMRHSIRALRGIITFVLASVSRESKFKPLVKSPLDAIEALATCQTSAPFTSIDWSSPFFGVPIVDYKWHTASRVTDATSTSNPHVLLGLERIFILGRLVCKLAALMPSQVKRLLTPNSELFKPNALLSWALYPVLLYTSTIDHSSGTKAKLEKLQNVASSMIPQSQDKLESLVKKIEENEFLHHFGMCVLVYGLGTSDGQVAMEFRLAQLALLDIADSLNQIAFSHFTMRHPDAACAMLFSTASGGPSPSVRRLEMTETLPRIILSLPPQGITALLRQSQSLTKSVLTNLYKTQWTVYANFALLKASSIGEGLLDQFADKMFCAKEGIDLSMAASRKKYRKCDSRVLLRLVTTYPEIFQKAISAESNSDSRSSKKLHALSFVNLHPTVTLAWLKHNFSSPESIERQIFASPGESQNIEAAASEAPTEPASEDVKKEEKDIEVENGGATERQEEEKSQVIAVPLTPPTPLLNSLMQHMDTLKQEGKQKKLSDKLPPDLRILNTNWIALKQTLPTVASLLLIITSSPKIDAKLLGCIKDLLKLWLELPDTEVEHLPPQTTSRLILSVALLFAKSLQGNQFEEWSSYVLRHLTLPGSPQYPPSEILSKPLFSDDLDHQFRDCLTRRLAHTISTGSTQGVIEALSTPPSFKPSKDTEKQARNQLCYSTHLPLRFISESRCLSLECGYVVPPSLKPVHVIVDVPLCSPQALAKLDRSKFVDPDVLSLEEHSGILIEGHHVMTEPVTPLIMRVGLATLSAIKELRRNRDLRVGDVQGSYSFDFSPSGDHTHSQGLIALDPSLETAAESDMGTRTENLFGAWYLALDFSSNFIRFFHHYTYQELIITNLDTREPLYLVLSYDTLAIGSFSGSQSQCQYTPAYALGYTPIELLVSKKFSESTEHFALGVVEEDQDSSSSLTATGAYNFSSTSQVKNNTGKATKKKSTRAQTSPIASSTEPTASSSTAPDQPLATHKPSKSKKVLSKIDPETVDIFSQPHDNPPRKPRKTPAEQAVVYLAKEDVLRDTLDDLPKKKKKKRVIEELPSLEIMEAETVPRLDEQIVPPRRAKKKRNTDVSVELNEPPPDHSETDTEPLPRKTKKKKKRESNASSYTLTLTSL